MRQCSVVDRHLAASCGVSIAANADKETERGRRGHERSREIGELVGLSGTYHAEGGN